MNKITVTFGYEGSSKEIEDMAMNVSYGHILPMELLCAGMMFNRFALEAFTRVAREKGNSMEQIRNTVAKASELINELAELQYYGEPK